MQTPRTGSIMNRSSIQLRRNGITLIEMVVVLAIIGMLCSILIPAVQRVRETARRVGCQSNLRQIGVGVADYESLYGVLPNGSGLRFTLLPFLGMSDIYSRYDPTIQSAGREPAYDRIRPIKIPLYLCPSEYVDPIQKWSWGGTVTASSYPSCFGSGLVASNFTFDGAFGVWGMTYSGPPCPMIRLSDITDGTSNVAAISEWLIGGLEKRRLRAVWETPLMYGPLQVDVYRDLCEYLPADPASLGWTGSEFHGFPWYSGAIGLGQYNHMLPPNRPSCLNGVGVIKGIHTAGSMHAGGVHLLYVDGHLEFQSENIDRRVWQRLGGRNNDAAGAN